jgi:type VI secretion system protein ImpC
MDATELILLLEQAHPMAARLARWSCLPVRVSPAFLRLARLRLLPQAGTGDEADLWLSDLVESRSGAGFAFRRAVREHLRESLRQDAAALDLAWHTVHLEHAPWLAARARLEEELTWRLLRDASDPAIEALWADVVRELDAGPNPEGVARWVTRAVEDLPSGTLEHASGRRAYRGAHLLLGDARVLGTDPQQFLETGEFAFATRKLPRRRIHVGLAQNSVIVSPLQAVENGHEIELPATQPLWLQLESETTSDSGTQRRSVLVLEDELPVVHETDFGPDSFKESAGLRLRGIDGAVHRLRPATAPTEPGLAETRPPRVQIEYDVEFYGSTKRIHLPFVVGVLADLAGTPSGPLPMLEERKFLEYDRDNFDSCMKSLIPRLAFAVDDMLLGEGTLSVDLRFESLADWAPHRLLYQVRPLQVWLATRKWLEELAGTLRDGGLHAEPVLRLLADRAELDLLAQVSVPPHPNETLQHELAELEADIEAIGRRLGAEDGRLREVAFRGAVAMARAVPVYGERALAYPDLLRGLESVVEQIGRRLGTQLDAILHHTDFQRLEGSWRGLHHLVSQTETSETLKIRVLCVSKAELARSLRRSGADQWDQSLLFKKVYEEQYGQFGGEPYGLLLGDYEFSHHAADVELLQSLAKIASAAHAPFLCAASPNLFQMESWQELVIPRDLAKLFSTPEYAAWRALRDSDESRYLGLAMPRILARSPYGPQDGMGGWYREDDTANGPSRFTWANAAYAMAANITRAFSRFGWCSAFRGAEGGGTLEGLPVHAFPADDGSVAPDCPAEIAISDRREAELATLGLMALRHRRGSVSNTAFISGRSLQRPAEYDDPDATANAALAAQWPYLFACCRFMHYLKCITRDRIGSYQTPEELQAWLMRWIMNYVDGQPDSSNARKAQYPLAAAEVMIQASEDRSAVWHMNAHLWPQYQLEGLTVSLRLVSRVQAPTPA